MAGSSLFGMGEKTMLYMMSLSAMLDIMLLSGRNMAESVPRKTCWET